MKFATTFKTPDVCHYATFDMQPDDRREAIKMMEQFIRYGEYVIVEFDTEANTATVLPK